MDGSNRRTLHRTTTDGLALDIQTQTLYWSNTLLGELESSNLDGTNRQKIAESVHTRQIIAESINTGHLAVLEANVFYYIDSYLKRINITDGANTTTLGRWIRCSTNDLQIVDQLKQPLGMSLLYICNYSQEKSLLSMYS